MAPSQKRKALEDDFIHTISDNEEDIVPAEEEELTPVQLPKKKTKVVAKKEKSKKKMEK